MRSVYLFVCVCLSMLCFWRGFLSKESLKSRHNPSSAWSRRSVRSSLSGTSESVCVCVCVCVLLTPQMGSSSEPVWLICLVMETIQTVRTVHVCGAQIGNKIRQIFTWKTAQWNKVLNLQEMLLFDLRMSYYVIILWAVLFILFMARNVCNPVTKC